MGIIVLERKGKALKFADLLKNYREYAGNLILYPKSKEKWGNLICVRYY